MNLRVSLVAALLCSALAAATATASTGAIPDQDAIEREALRLEIRQQLAPIRSQAELEDYLRDTPASASPFEALSPLARGRFLRSLKFNASGIAGYRYDDLEAELSPSQIHRILALFGSQDDLRLMPNARPRTALDRMLLQELSEMPDADYPAYECASPGNCKKKSKHICKSSC